MLGLKRLKMDLRTLITLLAIASIVITLANSLYASWRVQREVLIASTLESNRVYATKLASTTEMFFQLAQSQLSYSAKMLGDGMDNPDKMQAEVERLRQQTNSFNSVVIVDAKGWVNAISPESLMLKGVQLTTPLVRQALAERKPLISPPHISAANNLVILISSPVWSASGRYLGFVGGTIYLKKKSILNEMLGEQFYRDGSSLYVIDAEGRVLYHKDRQLVGGKLPSTIGHPIETGEDNGSRLITQNNGESALVGYAAVPISGWKIVAVKPTLTTLAPLSRLLLKVLLHAIPFALLTLITAWFLAWLIARPLWHLARNASQMDAPGVSQEINGIHALYFEASEIKRAMLSGIGLLQDKIGRLKYEVQTDPMTGLLNRRGLNAVLDYFNATRQPFAVLALDIDHFKQVNDTWGHAMGDSVIKRVASQLEMCSRQTDVVCRNGGEEFLMILPGTDRDTVMLIAERVRKKIEEQHLEVVGHISISVGVAFWAADDTPVERTFKLADDALYAAKNAGRNCVISHHTG